VHPPPAAWKTTHEEAAEMLAPLGLYLVIMLFTCTLSLLICWAYDTDRAEIRSTRSRPADPESVVDSILREWRPYFDPMDDTYHAV
jgi:hypothetical protein